MAIAWADEEWKAIAAESHTTRRTVTSRVIGAPTRAVHGGGAAGSLHHVRRCEVPVRGDRESVQHREPLC